MLGVVLGTLAAVLVIVIVSCLHCSCCLLYKKRQPSGGTGKLIIYIINDKLGWFPLTINGLDVFFILCKSVKKKKEL